MRFRLLVLLAVFCCGWVASDRVSGSVVAPVSVSVGVGSSCTDPGFSGHTVGVGESWESVAAVYGVGVGVLQGLNQQYRVRGLVLAVGDSLCLPLIKPVLVPEPVQVPVSITGPNVSARGFEKAEPFAVAAVDEFFAGLGGRVLGEAYLVVGCESSWRAGAHRSSVGRVGSGDHGLFQINHVHLGLVGGDAGLLFDPRVNARVARVLYDRNGWGDWYMSGKCHGLS